MNKIRLVLAFLLSPSLIPLITTPQAQAGIIVTGTEIGGNVVFSFEGSFDTSQSTFLDGSTLSFIHPSIARFTIGPGSNASLTPVRVRTGPGNPYALVPVLNFGSGGLRLADQTTGATFGIYGTNPTEQMLALPADYVPNSNITGSSTFLNATFASLNIAADKNYTYTFELSPGKTDTVLLQFVPVPEPLTMLGASAAIALGTAFKRRRQRVQNNKD